jgi:hypothetical protein
MPHSAMVLTFGIAGDRRRRRPLELSGRKQWRHRCPGDGRGLALRLMAVVVCALFLVGCAQSSTPNAPAVELASFRSGVRVSLSRGSLNDEATICLMDAPVECVRWTALSDAREGWHHTQFGYRPSSPPDKGFVVLALTPVGATLEPLSTPEHAESMELRVGARTQTIWYLRVPDVNNSLALCGAYAGDRFPIGLSYNSKPGPATFHAASVRTGC